MRLMAGTSGFSYKEWKGPFYPADLPSGSMLEFYASRLGAVEINNTFYRLPRRERLEGWSRQVPEGFRFSIKASRRITHFKRLKPESLEETGYLLETTATLGERLGAVLFQLPPNMKVDVPRLASFVERLPEGVRGAFEFRHDSWADAEVEAVLRERNLAMVCADTDDEDEDAALVPTADWGYLRLRRPGYTDQDLARWAGSVRAQGWKEALVFFKHEDEGAGPRMAQRFVEVFEEPE